MENKSIKLLQCSYIQFENKSIKKASILVIYSVKMEELQLFHVVLYLVLDLVTVNDRLSAAALIKVFRFISGLLKYIY